MILSLQTRISDLITAIGTDYKQLRTWISGSSSGDLTGLTTTDKSSLVAAINETKAGNSGSPPDSSETVKGIIELATLVEVGTGTDAVRAVTPQGVRQERTAIEALIPAATPAASETVAGKVELATLAEVATGTDATRAVTAAGVKQETAAVVTPASSVTVAGKIEIATLAEVGTGTDTSRAVTPEGVRQERTAIVALIPPAPSAASETVAGILELATLAEVATGTDALRAVTPAGVRAERTALKAEILGAGVPAALDTLDELAAALADDANYAATITTALGNKQPLDADLTAIAALTSAADKVPYSTGAQAWALATLTAAGRALIDDADIAAQRATLSVYSQAELGNFDTDLAALYVTAKA